MSKNVRNFKGYNNKSGSVNNCNKNQCSSNYTRADAEQDVQSQFNKYSGYSENQLIDEFYKEVYKQKQMGNLSPEMLENFYNMMSPNMSPAQKKKMKALIDSIK